MLADHEWLTPHDRPGGGSIAEWVERVRWLEANGWLRDPAEIAWPSDPEHPANRAQARDQLLCPPLCWRARCRRAGRCRHLMPLAIREFMPEFSVHISKAGGEVSPWRGPVDQGKLALLAELLPFDHPCGADGE
ncbi:MAG: hypothetical protein HY245_15705 [Rhizobiales bacterium]|nr:hypothetical protein [Hyphomicrobiales bacterium]MBI3674831.1 hypothetical protein [Hyphomicrobiales bacterium]